MVARFLRLLSTQAKTGAENLLHRFIVDRIRATGPIGVAEYMQMVAARYYQNKEKPIFGRQGDFVTSPEFSQMFGELLGVWAIHEVTNGMGHRQHWQLVELGPGSGALMGDVLKVVNKHVPSENLSVHFVEFSDHLAKRQHETVCAPQPLIESSVDGNEPYFMKSQTRHGNRTFWYYDVGKVPKDFSLFIAHEFFDALPVHQFQRTADGSWREMLVTLDDENQLQLAVANRETIASKAYLTQSVQKLCEGADFIEISPNSAAILEQLVLRITENGGIVLLIDYGDYGFAKNGNTLRGFKEHRVISNILESTGTCDITADVNFAYLINAVKEKCLVFGPIPQAEFLRNLGLDLRFEQLIKKCKSDQERTYLKRSYELLTSTQEMGERFKVVAFYPKVMEKYFNKVRRQPAGFART